MQRLPVSALLFVLFYNLALLNPTSAQAQYVVGETGPNFTLPDLEGNPIDLYSFQDQIIVVNFFATWCPGCNVESVQLQHDIYETYRDQGVVVVGIDLLESAQLVSEWQAEMALTYPLLLAPDYSLFQQFPVAGGLPYNAIFDTNMVLQYAQYGFNLDHFIGVIESILDTSPVRTEPVSLGSIKAIYR